MFAAPSGPPKNVHVYPLTSRALQVTWKPPDAQEHNGLIKGYYLGYRLYGSTGPYVYKTLDAKLGDNSDSLGTKIINLNKASKYGVILQAFNGKGAGPQSEEVVSETLSNDPPPAAQLTITSAEYASVEVAWNFEDTYPNSKDNDVVINGYFLYYKSHHSVWEEKQISGQFLSHSFTNLQCGTYYQFYVIAYNGVGKGDPSQVVSAKTKGSGLLFFAFCSAHTLPLLFIFCLPFHSSFVFCFHFISLFDSLPPKLNALFSNTSNFRDSDVHCLAQTTHELY